MISILDMFSVGVGPSSSHTVGPMRAANAFVSTLGQGELGRAGRVHVDLYGSLAMTGLGHGSDRAAMAGLEGFRPDTIDPDVLLQMRERCESSHSILIAGSTPIGFDYARDVEFHMHERLSGHANGMVFTLLDGASGVLARQVWYSIGGGFIRPGSPDDQIIDDGFRPTDPGHAETRQAALRTVGAGPHSEADRTAPPVIPPSPSPAEDPASMTGREGDLVPYPYTTMDGLLALCAETGLPMDRVVMENEAAISGADRVRTTLAHSLQVMEDCIRRGCVSQEGMLPGGLKVARRAPAIFKWFSNGIDHDPLSGRVPPADLLARASESEWTDLFALAVSEENAGGGRIVTAPTNGSAGVLPAVIEYYRLLVPGSDQAGIGRLLLIAGAIGVLFKSNASISGAEVGCQGEIGSACSMAAGGLCAALGGSPRQIENAAEIGMEHNLGLTCDPIGGLVQIPCIERNAMAANTAINAARIALLGNGEHIVSLDQAIATMKQTGLDMMDKYKETSQGGLAVNVVEC